MSTTDMRIGKQRLLAFFCCLAYFTSYITRINYTAVRIAIADELALTHPEWVIELGIAISAASITYGIGQFVSGILGDRLSPIAMVGAGLGGAVLCNLLMPILYPSTYWMALIWGINGFFQALIRPPLGRIIASNFDEKGYINTCVAVSNSSQVATVLVYLIIPLCLRLFDNEWRLAFYLPVIAGLVTLSLWFLIVPKITVSNRPTNTEPSAPQQQNSVRPEPLIAVLVRSGLLLMIPAVLIHGLLRDGITAWMPDFIVEIGGLRTDISILTTAILPVFCIVCVLVAKKVCVAYPSDGITSALLFAFSAAAALAIVLLLDHVTPLTFFVIVLLMAWITGCMHAVNHIFITRIPGAFKQVGRVSGIVGILNAITYVGGALSPYAVAAVAGNGGWNRAVMLWVILAALSTLLCLMAYRKWNLFKTGMTR